MCSPLAYIHTLIPYTPNVFTVLCTYYFLLAGAKIKEATVLSSFRERYTAVRRLAISSSTTTATTTANDAKGNGGTCKTVCIEVQFIGPQPSQGPGALLCNLLSGTSVEARPIELRRGRENKRKRRGSGSDEGSDAGER